MRKQAMIGGVRSLLVLTIAAASLGGLIGERALAGPYDWDLAVYDRILAGVQPGQATVQFGDMVVTVAKLQQWRQAVAAANGTGLGSNSATNTNVPLWTGGNVYYAFNPATGSTVSPAHQTDFIDAATEWATFANIRFIPRTTQNNYILVTDAGTGLDGGNSFVGMVGGAQALNVGTTSWNRPTLVHEIGHALGLVHEHQRMDRDNYVTILTQNIVSGSESNFTVIPTSIDNGTYDFLSVMHYSRNAFSTNTSLDTIEPKAGFTQYLNVMGLSIEQVLSRSDRLGMAAMYGTGPALSSTVTNTQDSGLGSLRAAIYFALDHEADFPGTPVTIGFNIPTTDPGYNGAYFTIQLVAQLPAPGPGTIIDGTTQIAFTGNTNPNGPVIALDGSLAAPPDTFAVGMRLSQSGCVLKGLAIGGFSEQGVLITGSAATGNSLQGCYIGTSPNGSSANANADVGVLIQAGASGNIIGGTAAGAGNVISGNSTVGVRCTDAGTNSNVLEGNRIGVTASGAAALANTFQGVEIQAGSANNTVGGSVAGSGNVISGNGSQGIIIHDSGTNGTTVTGNLIGTNAAGTAAITNGAAGISIYNGAQSTTVGGATTGARNVISGNTNEAITISDPGSTGNVVLGNYIGINAAGTASIPNKFEGIAVYNAATGNTIGGTNAGSRNIISGNASYGITIDNTGTANNVVEGNYIGTDPTGMTAIPNAFGGLLINGASNNLVGGLVVGSGNLISGNTDQGVILGFTLTTGNTVEGNVIGLNAAGTGTLGNGFAGVELTTMAQNNTIGGTTAAARNIISGNKSQGVAIDGSGAQNNAVYGNYIGLDPTGTTAIPNAFAGAEIFGGGPGNFIGGPKPGMGNVISGNSSQGVALDTSASGNTVAGNLIGLNAAGTAAAPNTFAGVEMFAGATSNTIGGTNGGRNFIAGNSYYGIAIDGSGTNSNVVVGNTIGLAPSGATVANANGGVVFFSGAQSNVVGGSAAGAANLISGNTQRGVDIFDSTTTGNTISGNSIYGNGGIGINLVGGSENSFLVTANDTGDADTGPNNLQNYPVLSSSVLGIGTNVQGTLNSIANGTFRIELFASATADPSGHGPGQNFLGAFNVTTDGSGNASFNLTFAPAVLAGQVISATATDASGNTSEFSANVAVTTTDSDNDGIPDVYENAHGLNPHFNDANLDADGDGVSNLAEFLAGTDPKNPNSVFRLAPPTFSNGDVIITLSTVAGHVYRIEYANDLTSTNHWRTLADQVLASGSSLQVTDPGAASAGKRFYRAIVLP